MFSCILLFGEVHPLKKPYTNKQTFYLGLVLQIVYCTFTIVQLMEHFLTWLHIGLL